METGGNLLEGVACAVTAALGLVFVTPCSRTTNEKHEGMEREHLTLTFSLPTKSKVSVVSVVVGKTLPFPYM